MIYFISCNQYYITFLLHFNSFFMFFFEKNSKYGSELFGDDSDGEAVAVLKDHHDGHGEEAIDLAGDSGEFASGVVGTLQLDGDEDVRFQQAALNGIVGEEGGFAAEFLVGELEDQVAGFPLGDEGFLFVQRVS